jgi:DNA polymerase III subunit epsilon
MPKKIAFVDVETTGGSPINDRIMEVGIIRVENGEVTAQYDSLINPQVQVPPFIQDMTGISDDDLVYAPTFDVVKDEVLSLLTGCSFIAHNVEFDYGFIRNEFKRVGLPIKLQHMCTVKLSRFFYPQFRHHNLDSIIERFNIECENRHRALGDALVIYKFYNQLLKEFPENKWKKALQRTS